MSGGKARIRPKAKDKRVLEQAKQHAPKIWGLIRFPLQKVVRQ